VRVEYVADDVPEDVEREHSEHQERGDAGGDPPPIPNGGSDRRRMPPSERSRTVFNWRYASSTCTRMSSGIWRVSAVTTVAVEFGTRCRLMTWRSLAPALRAART